MARRGENIYHRKDGRWEGRYLKEEMNGTKYVSVYGQSYEEVKDLLAIKREQGIRKRVNRCFLTVKELFLCWLQAMETEVKASTYARYRMIVERHIIACFKDMPAVDLTAHKLSTYLREKAVHGRLDGKGGLSPKTVRDLGIVVKTAMKYGRKRFGLVNDIFEAELPAYKQRCIETLSACETTLIAQAVVAQPDISKVGFLLALNSGLRLGELCALRWSDIDFYEGVVSVSRTVIRIGDGNGKTKLIMQTPKSDTSVRRIPLPMDMVQLLKQFRAAENTFLLTGKNVPMEPRTYQYRYKSFMIQHGLRYRCFHTLRHSYATRCLESGIDVKTLSELLGHADISTTLKLYTHPSLEHKKQCVQRISFIGAIAG